MLKSYPWQGEWKESGISHRMAVQTIQCVSPQVQRLVRYLAASEVASQTKVSLGGCVGVLGRTRKRLKLPY